MATPTNAQLGKLIASYLSTSNDALAIHFRKHYSPTISPTSPRTTKTKRPTPRVTNATFTYRWLTTAPHRITNLYQYLLRAKWIASDTPPDDFLAIFSGEVTNCKIRWTGKKTYLVYLFRLLTDKKYISTPKGIGRWMIVGSHFIDAHNRLFTLLNSQRIPVKAQQTIEQLSELLNTGHF